MRKLILLLVATLVLIACGADNKKHTQSQEIPAIGNDSAAFVMGVVNTDTILEKYTFAVQARESMTKKAEDARLSLNTKAKQLQQEMAEFQNKIENNAFLSRERAEQEAARLQKKEADIMQHRETLENQLMEEQQKLSQQLKDSIDLAIKEINKDRRFAVILSTSSLTDNVLYADDALVVTNEVLEFLNSRFRKK